MTSPATSLKVAQKRLGHRIRTLRRQKGWTQRQFARACGLHKSHMTEVERGSNVTLSTLVIIARRLHSTIADLFEGVA
jgi:transcriptional regulator with XRE-family HTH domain